MSYEDDVGALERRTRPLTADITEGQAIAIAAAFARVGMQEGALNRVERAALQRIQAAAGRVNVATEIPNSMLDPEALKRLKREATR